MANRPDNETRALLDALCEWLVTDMKFMPVAATSLRERFEAATAPRGMLQHGKTTQEVATIAKRN